MQRQTNLAAYLFTLCSLNHAHAQAGQPRRATLANVVDQHGIQGSLAARCGPGMREAGDGYAVGGERARVAGLVLRLDPR